MVLCITLWTNFLKGNCNVSFTLDMTRHIVVHWKYWCYYSQQGLFPFSGNLELHTLSLKLPCHNGRNGSILLTFCYKLKGTIGWSLSPFFRISGCTLNQVFGYMWKAYCPNLGSFGPIQNLREPKNCLLSSATSKFWRISAARPFGADCSALGWLSKAGNTAF